MDMHSPAGPPASGTEPDPLEAAFAALPAPEIPGTLLPALVAGIPGAGRLIGGSAANLPTSAGTHSPTPRPSLLWWVAGAMAAAACVAIAAVVVPLLRTAPDSFDVLGGSGPTVAQAVDYSSLTQDMTTIILKDTDPCRILSPQAN